MGAQQHLWEFSVFLLLTSSFSHGKNAAVQVVGIMNCKDCINREFNGSPPASSGINVFVSCKSGEKTAKGNGEVDREGKFTLSLLSADDISENGDSIDGCFALLQSAAQRCPIETAQTASVELRTQHKPAAAVHEQTLIKFSPVTCQSALFWPLPNITTFFHSPPPSPEQPIEYNPLPSPAAPPAQTPLPPADASIPPTVPPPAPEFRAPSPQPEDTFTTPFPAPQPAYQIPQNPPSQPPVPIQNSPSFSPTVSPIPTPSPESPPRIPPAFASHPSPSPSPHHSMQFPPIHKKACPPRNAGHFHKQPFPTIPPIGTPETPLNHIKPSPIPRAPPVPKLPNTPTIPRKYFNTPEPKAHPPRPSS